jgi:SAM-dependent methyltransferase
MNLVNSQDVLDVYYRLRRRGVRSITDRLRLARRARVEAAWDHSETEPKLWTNIDTVRRTLNCRVTGDPAVEPLRWFADKYLKPLPGLRALSLGSGAGHVEAQLSTMCTLSSLEGIEISRNLTEKANAQARREGRKELRFICGDILSMDLPQSAYDLVFAHHSLHHFANVSAILTRAKRALKPDGLLAFEEYVGPNRFQWRREQLHAINDLLRQIPPRYRKRHGLSIEKTRVKAPGLLRMLISDPSEAIDSESILPFVRKNFEILELKKMGGTISHMLFHDIAHNFAASDSDALSFVTMVMEEERRLIEQGTLQSDFVFVVAKNREGQGTARA